MKTNLCSCGKDCSGYRKLYHPEITLICPALDVKIRIRLLCGSLLTYVNANPRTMPNVTKLREFAKVKGRSLSKI